MKGKYFPQVKIILVQSWQQILIRLTLLEEVRRSSH